MDLSAVDHQLFGQFATLAAVLGGFAFTTAGILLASPSDARSRARDLVVGASLVAALCFVVSAVGLTAVSMRALAVAVVDGRAASEATLATGGFLVLVMLLGVGSLLVSIAACGWIQSRRLGRVTTAAACAAAALLVGVLWLAPAA